MGSFHVCDESVKVRMGRIRSGDLVEVSQIAGTGDVQKLGPVVDHRVFRNPKEVPLRAFESIHRVHDDGQRTACGHPASVPGRPPAVGEGLRDKGEHDR